MRRNLNQISVKVVGVARRNAYVFRWAAADGTPQQIQSKWPFKPSLRGKAERDAKELEDRLNLAMSDTNDCAWPAFIQRYEQEHLPSLKPKSRKAWVTARGHVEELIQPMFLADVDATALSKMSASLRKKTKRRPKGVSEATIKTYLATIKAAIGWGVDMGLLDERPKVRMPKRAKGTTKRMRSRPVTGEEFDRLIAKLPPDYVELAHGLYDGGLRISEALSLSWNRFAEFAVDMTGRRPMFRITSEGQKSGEDQPLPIAPELAARLEATPKANRRGSVYGISDSLDKACKIIAAAGEGIVVSPNGKTATAHDLRRAFGTRWAKRVQPAVLQQLMRHKSIETTMSYYVDMNADELYNALPGGASGGAQPSGRVKQIVKEPVSIEEIVT